MGRDSATFWDKGTDVSSLSRDKGTSSKSCHGTGQDSLSKSGTGHGTGQSLFLCQNRGRDKDGTGQSLFFSMISYFRTSSSCFRASFPVLEPPSPVLEPPFPGESDCALGFPGQRDKGTTGQGIIFVPGQRDNGTSNSGLSWDVLQDVLSLGNPTLL